MGVNVSGGFWGLTISNIPKITHNQPFVPHYYCKLFKYSPQETYTYLFINITILMDPKWIRFHLFSNWNVSRKQKKTFEICSKNFNVSFFIVCGIFLQNIMEELMQENNFSCPFFFFCFFEFQAEKCLS